MAQPPLLAVSGLAKSFGGVVAADGLALTLGEGELLAVIGPNGCGKTTLFNLASGALRPDAGSIRFRGREIVGLPPWRIARLGIGRKFQVPGIFPQLSVAENLAVPRPADGAPGGAAGDAAEVERLLALAGLAARRDWPAGELPHGAKQWLEIAMLLAGRPSLLLLDEPTAGMSAAETRATADLIARIRAERGVAAIVIEHDMGFVERLDCRVAVMLRGTVAAEGRFAEVRRDARVREAYLGRRA